MILDKSSHTKLPQKQNATMKKFRFSLLSLVILVAAVTSGCSSLNRNASSDDLYTTHNKIAIAQREAAEAELAKAQALAEKARYEQMLAEQQAAEAEQAYYNSLRTGDNRRGTTIYADDADVVIMADSRYARRMYMFDNYDVYILPSSYYAWSYSPYYDPFYHNLPPRYWNGYLGSWGWSVGSAGWHFYWNSSWYDPWYASWNYGWYNPYWGPYYPSYHPHHHHHHGHVWPGWGPGPGSGGHLHGSHRPSHQPGYRTFDNGYKAPIASRNPSVTGAPARGNSANSNTSGGGYRGSTPSRSDFTKPGRTTNGTAPSRVNSNTSRPSSSSSSNKGTSTSTTYRRGTSSSSSSGTVSRPSNSSSSSHSYTPPTSSGSNRTGSSGGFSGGGNRGGSSSGSGRSAGGR